MRRPVSTQPPLPFAPAASYAAEDFVAAGSNRQALQWLARPAGWPEGRLVVWGAAGCGKTHLLHNWAAAHGAEIFSGPDLHGFCQPPSHAVAVDDADLATDEPALLHLLNAAAEAGQIMLLAMRAPPARACWGLADLASRLRAAQAVEIAPAEEALLAAILARLAAARQIGLSDQVRNFLLTHLERSPAALREAVARLDQAALARGARITRQLAAEILADLAR